MKKIVLAIGILSLIIMTVLSGCTQKQSNSSKPTVKHPKVLQIAILTNMAPYTYVDKNGKFQGYDYEFLKKVDQMLPQYKFQYHAVSPDSAAAAVKAGTYALSCSAHFITPARQKQYILSYPEDYFPINLVSRKSDSFTKFTDLKNQRIVPDPPNDGLYVVLHELLSKHPGMKIKEQQVSDYVPYDESIKGVSTGRWDVWFGGKSIYDSVIKQDPMKNLYISKPIYSAACVAVINKNQTDLKNQMNKVILKLYKSGYFAKLSQKWLGEDVWKIAKDTHSLDPVFTK